MMVHIVREHDALKTNLGEHQKVVNVDVSDIRGTMGEIKFMTFFPAREKTRFGEALARLVQEYATFEDFLKGKNERVDYNERVLLLQAQQSADGSMYEIMRRVFLAIKHS